LKKSAIGTRGRGVEETEGEETEGAESKEEEDPVEEREEAAKRA
jgi:hypothetical protein